MNWKALWTVVKFWLLAITTFVVLIVWCWALAWIDNNHPAVLGCAIAGLFFILISYLVYDTNS
jgi:hypothetical protein